MIDAKHDTSEKKSKEDVIEIPVSKFTSKMRKNPWIVSTIVLGLIVIFFIMYSFKGGEITGNVVSGDEAGNTLASFINSNGLGSAKYISSEKEGQLYKISIEVDGQEAPIYVTLDGQYAIAQPIPITGNASTSNADTTGTTNTPTEVPKSDKPKVELFIMSYCPYGTQMEKAILPVISTLKDKIDFKLRYTHFTLHGEKEDTEDFRQLCIREEQGSKFLPYIQCILNSTDPYNPGNVTQCMNQLGIDANKVNSCVTTKAADYYSVDSGLSEGYGVQGSPTLVINGVQVQSSRSPAAVLETICSAFNNAPSECNTQLPTTQASPGFGFGTSSADTAAVQCRV